MSENNSFVNFKKVANNMEDITSTLMKELEISENENVLFIILAQTQRSSIRIA